MTKRELKQMLKLALLEIERLREDLSESVAYSIEKQWIINEFQKEAEKRIKDEENKNRKKV